MHVLGRVVLPPLPCISNVNTLRGKIPLLRLLTSIYDTIITGAGLSMCAGGVQILPEIGLGT